MRLGKWAAAIGALIAITLGVIHLFVCPLEFVLLEISGERKYDIYASALCDYEGRWGVRYPGRTNYSTQCVWPAKRIVELRPASIDFLLERLPSSKEPVSFRMIQCIVAAGTRQQIGVLFHNIESGRIDREAALQAALSLRVVLSRGESVDLNWIDALLLVPSDHGHRRSLLYALQGSVDFPGYPHLGGWDDAKIDDLWQLFNEWWKENRPSDLLCEPGQRVKRLERRP
jgi:hypothetical protein